MTWSASCHSQRRIRSSQQSSSQRISFTISIAVQCYYSYIQETRVFFVIMDRGSDLYVTIRQRLSIAYPFLRATKAARIIWKTVLWVCCVDGYSNDMSRLVAAGILWRWSSEETSWDGMHAMLLVKWNLFFPEEQIFPEESNYICI